VRRCGKMLRWDPEGAAARFEIGGLRSAVHPGSRRSRPGAVSRRRFGGFVPPSVAISRAGDVCPDDEGRERERERERRGIRAL